MSGSPGRIHVGTCGWSYPHWKGCFYPSDLPEARMLEHYAQHFAAVEINSCFYRLPETRTLRSWAAAVPPGFLFAAKASRYITHMKKLSDPGPSLRPFLRRMTVLADRLGPILFQLPPRWRFDEARLLAFLRALSDEHRYAFEFRDPSWLNERAYEALARHRAALCLYDLGGKRSPRVLTTDFVYVRLHGPDEAYCGSYDARALARWSQRLTQWATEGRHAYCFFDNDEAGYAARDAARLQKRLAAEPKHGRSAGRNRC